MKQDTNAARQSGNRGNRPDVMPLGLWIRCSVTGKCFTMGGNAVMGYGGSKAHKTLNYTCFPVQQSAAVKYWMGVGHLKNAPILHYVSGAKFARLMHPISLTGKFIKPFVMKF